MDETLKELHGSVKLKGIEENSELNPRNGENIKLPAFPSLSAFQRELEEAANEPLMMNNGIDGDEEATESDVDEIDNVTEEHKEQEEENKSTNINTSIESLSNALKQPSCQFATPTTNKVGSNLKYTPGLMTIQECGFRKVVASKEILQTPKNNLFFTNNLSFTKYNFMGINKNIVGNVPCTEVKRDNNKDNSKMNKSMDNLSNGVKQGSIKDILTSDKRCIKQLSFNGLITPKNSGITSIPTPTIKIGDTRESTQKATKKLLDNIKPSHETKTLHKNKEDSNRIHSATSVNSEPIKSKKNLLTDEKSYLASLKNNSKNTENEHVSQQETSKVNEKNKENVAKSQPNGVCTVYIEKELVQFDKIVVNNVEYIVLNQLGRGGSSIVYNCYNPISKVVRAIKKVSLRGDKACVQGYINEVQMLHKLQNCDRIIKMFSYEKSGKLLFMVLEKGEQDLSSVLKELTVNTTRLPIYMLIYYWMEMLYAVKQIHENGIIHSDLKPANFLFTPGGLKLIDFGIASAIQSDMTSVVKNVQIGSFNYISPEAVQNNSCDSGKAEFKISYKSDVWSLGCILYQLVYRKTPFQHIGNVYAKLAAILDPNQQINYPDVDWIPANIISTIKACLKFDMKSRPSVDELIEQYENIYY